MFRVPLPRATALAAAATSLVALASSPAQAAAVPGTFADQVVSYDPGTNRFQFNLYTNPSTALGPPRPVPAASSSSPPSTTPSAATTSSPSASAGRSR